MMLVVNIESGPTVVGTELASLEMSNTSGVTVHAVNGYQRNRLRISYCSQSNVGPGMSLQWHSSPSPDDLPPRKANQLREGWLPAAKTPAPVGGALPNPP